MGTLVKDLSLLFILGTTLLIPQRFAYPVENIIKSPNDQRDYASITLANQLSVLLISDPETDKAAAALDIRVGSGSDPGDYPGLAHFLEHMLFLGTEKYPQAGAYETFITTHGGSINAATALHHSSYFFDIDKDYLRPALDHFAQVFTAPLFPSEYIAREKHAIDAELQSKRQDDKWRSLHVFKHRVNRQHPYAKFTVGSLTTLSATGDNDDTSLRAALIDFFQHHYSANLMSLVVLGSQPLDQLDTWVRQLFAAIPNTHARPQYIEQTLFTPAQLPLRLDIRSNKQQQLLTLTFPIAATEPHYLTKPIRYLSAFIHHQGSGGLLALLRQKGWVEQLHTQRSRISDRQALFKIMLQLSQAGYTNIEAITAHVFQYLRLIQQQGVEPQLYAEQSQLAELAFRFQDTVKAQTYVRWLANRQHYYPIKDILRGSYAMDEFSADIINHYLNQLTPDNVILTVLGTEVSANAQEPWLQIPYHHSLISTQTLQYWHESTISDALQLPDTNPFIPNNLTVKPLQEDNDKPELLYQKSGLSLWYKQDDRFRVPRADFYLTIRSPLASSSASYAVLNKLFVKQLTQQLKNHTYSAQLGGLNVTLYDHSRGLSIKLSGYNDKQLQLLALIMSTLQRPQLSQTTFALDKQALTRSLHNTEQLLPYRRALVELRTLLLTDQWSAQQQLAALATIDFADLEQFATEFFATKELAALAHGNLYRAEAITFANALASHWLTAQQTTTVMPRQVLKPEQAANTAIQLASTHNDSALTLYFQGSDNSFANQALFRLLAQLIARPFYNDLRTQQQLGYVVSAAAMPLRNIPGLALVVQSPNTEPQQLEQHVERFLTAFGQRLTEVSEDDLANHKQGLSKRILSRAQTLTERSQRYWQEINHGYLDFNSREQLAAATQAIGKAELVNAYQQLITDEPQRRLIIRTVGRHANSEAAPQQNAL